ncbi:unnamed protein product [Rotaria sp. Silwood1]|nr:unnamed protein product [Rotaria sp. Silwood1]
MHDEATTHYNSIIDQHSLGAEFLRDTFGECARPKIGWQIDPFGHSREVASLFAQMGFDGLLFGRIDYQDRIPRTLEKNLEMVWKASANLENGSNVNVFYSTPSCYLYALNKAEKKWISKSDDFFPYASIPFTYWTGYFTSRPALKRYERYTNNILQVTRQLNGFSQTNLRNNIFDLSEAMGIVQHHDAISGTEKQHVANDYAQRLSDGIDRAVFTLTLWNPTIHPVTIHPRVPVTREYLIRDPIGNLVPAEIYLKLFVQGFSGDPTTPEFPPSGAYIFRPFISEAVPVSLSRKINCTKTDIVQKASIIFNEWVSQEISLFRGKSEIELEWTVGPIPIDDNIGKEIIIRYNTNIESASKYYTDANGREVLERIRNHRPTWPYFVDERISGNYYPINSRIWIRDRARQLTILTDRSEGGGSMHDGSIEIMVHRRILHDDSLGVGEALNETAYGKGLVVSGKHILLVERPTDSARLHRIGAQQLFMHPLATYSLSNTSSYANYSNIYRQSWSAISDAMPLNVHLLTFDQLSPKQYLVRVEHYFELNEDEIYSQPVTIDLQTLFKSIGTIAEMIELILSANLPLSELHRLDWMTKDEESSYVNMFQQQSSKATTITLNPMQIRTFQITIA